MVSGRWFAVLIIGVSIAAIWSYSVFNGIDSPPSSDVVSDVGEKPFTDVAQLQLIENPVEKDSDLEADVLSLSQQVAWLRAELFALKKEFQKGAALTSASTASAVNSNLESPGQKKFTHHPAVNRDEFDKEALRFGSYIQTIEANFHNDDVNDKWAIQASEVIKHALNEDSLAGSSLNSMECRSSLCRVSVSHMAIPDRDLFAQDFPARVSSEFSEIVYAPSSDDQNNLETVLYLYRTGHQPPAMAAVVE